VKKIFESLRQFKEWIEQFAIKPYALWVLLWIAFVEASFFPISVDVLLIALGVTAPKKSLMFALVATIGSVMGGYLGYYIGYALFDVVGKPLLGFHGMINKFDIILDRYHQNGVGVLVFSGFIPIPYIVFTFAAGFNHTIDLLTLTIGSLIGRSLRFFLVGALLYSFGARVKVFLERYFETVSIVCIILIIVGIIISKWLV
jgi:membrane protein YqaA with SNARE-associated domain